MNTMIKKNIFLLLLATLFLSSEATGKPSQKKEFSHKQLAEFAQCITEKGWTMYSSFTCSACSAQRNLFGEAYNNLTIIECNPHAPDTQVEQCLKKKIRYTPTWLREKDGNEIKRFKGYKELENLASITGCPL